MRKRRGVCLFLPSKHGCVLMWRADIVPRFRWSQRVAVTPDVVMVSSVIKACDAGQNWWGALQLLEFMHVSQLQLGCLGGGAPPRKVRIQFVHRCMCVDCVLYCVSLAFTLSRDRNMGSTP